MKQIGEEYFLDADFFDQGTQDQMENRLAKSILLNAIHRLLRPDLQEIPSAATIWITLRDKFFLVNRQAQINAWRTFINPDLSKFKTTALLVSGMRDSVTTLKQLKVNLNIDDFLGLILHDKLQESYRYKEDFDRRIDFWMQSHQDAHPSYDELVRQLDLMRTGTTFCNDITSTATHTQTRLPSTTLST